jgi:hypothetical protein|tara:strand:- start:593 stop:1027 length:435 start_codon:yes stop_codon:yes gene_type:complete
MSIEKSVVAKVTPNGTWDGQYGLMYKFEIEFENGQGGEYLSKFENQTKFVVGEETEYERTERGQFVKIKPVSNFQPGQSSGGGFKKDDNVQKMIVRQSSLKASIDLICAGKIEPQDWKKSADSFVDWVYGKEDSSLPFEGKAPF